MSPGRISRFLSLFSRENFTLFQSSLTLSSRFPTHLRPESSPFLGLILVLRRHCFRRRGGRHAETDGEEAEEEEEEDVCRQCFRRRGGRTAEDVDGETEWSESGPLFTFFSSLALSSRLPPFGPSPTVVTDGSKRK